MSCFAIILAWIKSYSFNPNTTLDVRLVIAPFESLIDAYIIRNGWVTGDISYKGIGNMVSRSESTEKSNNKFIFIVDPVLISSS